MHLPGRARLALPASVLLAAAALAGVTLTAGGPAQAAPQAPPSCKPAGHWQCPTPTPTGTTPAPTPTPTPTSPSPTPTGTGTGTACAATLGQNCGPYDYPQIPMSNGYDTYVMNQAVGPQQGTTQTITAYDPGNWSMVADDRPYGYTGVQTFDAVQQLTNDWNGSGWGGATADTPLSALSALTVHYAETSPQDAGSIYEFAPDVWNDSYGSDVMFWADTSPVRCTDNGLSTGDILGQATLGGQPWTVYRYGGAGSEIIFILDGTSGTDPVTSGTCARQASGTIDILAGFQWLAAHGVMPGPGSLSQLNTGWEITSADNTTFTMTGYSITATVGP